MRKLDRTITPAPEILVAPGKAGQTETAAAIALFSKRKKPVGAKFEYKAYADESVKLAVSAISFDKCAYCEVKALAGQDGDIEHFRPKGEINNKEEKPIKPGYYWLGANWDNLFLSCMHCNQARIQPTQTGTKKTMGKKNQFPLRDPKKRIKSPKRPLKDEEPYRLLLHPCLDSPEEHLFFDRDGMVFPATKNNKESDMGKASIEVFGLLRNNLVKARRDHAARTEITLSMMDDYLAAYNDAIQQNSPQAVIDLRRADLEKQITKLRGLITVNQEYSLLTFYIIRNHLAKFNIVFTL